MDKNNLINHINTHQLNIVKTNKHYPFLYFTKLLNDLNITNFEYIQKYILYFINNSIITPNKEDKYLISNNDNKIDNNIYKELIEYTKYLYLSEENDIENNIQFFAYFFKYLSNKSNIDNQIILHDDSINNIFKMTDEDIYHFLENILFSNYKQHVSFTLFPLPSEDDLKKLIIELLKNYDGVIDNINSQYVRNRKNIYDSVYRVHIPFPLSFYITKNKIIKLSNCIDIATKDSKINIFFSVNNEKKLIKLNNSDNEIIIINKYDKLIDNIEKFNNANMRNLTFNEFKQIINFTGIVIKDELYLMLYFLFRMFLN